MLSGTNPPSEAFPHFHPPAWNHRNHPYYYIGPHEGEQWEDDKLRFVELFNGWIFTFVSTVIGKVAKGERPAGEVAKGAEGKACRIKLYSGTDFVFSGKAAKYIIRGASKFCAPHLPLSRLSHLAEGIPPQPLCLYPYSYQINSNH